MFFKESPLWIWRIELFQRRDSPQCINYFLSSSCLSHFLAPVFWHICLLPTHGDWTSDSPSHWCLMEEQMPRLLGSELGPGPPVTLYKERGFAAWCQLSDVWPVFGCLKWAGGINGCLMTEIRVKLTFWLTGLPKWVAAGSSLLGSVTLFISRTHL